MPIKTIAIAVACAGLLTLPGCSQAEPSAEKFAEFFETMSHGYLTPPAESFKITKAPLKGIYAVDLQHEDDGIKFYSDATGNNVFVPSENGVRLVNIDKFFEIRKRVDAGEITPEEAEELMENP